MGKFQINMFFYMHAALLCLESQKMQDLQHKNIRIFKYERKKMHIGIPSITWVFS